MPFTFPFLHSIAEKNKLIRHKRLQKKFERKTIPSNAPIRKKPPPPIEKKTHHKGKKEQKGPQHDHKSPPLKEKSHKKAPPPYKGNPDTIFLLMEGLFGLSSPPTKLLQVPIIAQLHEREEKIFLRGFDCFWRFSYFQLFKQGRKIRQNLGGLQR